MVPNRLKRSSRTATMVLATMFAASACAGTVAATGEAIVGPAGQADSSTSNIAGSGPDGSVLDAIETVEADPGDPSTEEEQLEGPSDPDSESGLQHGDTDQQSGTDSDDSGSGSDQDDDGDDEHKPAEDDTAKEEDEDEDEDDEVEVEEEEPVVPGSPLDFGPAAGTSLTVVGVRYDDRLNFRAHPSPSATILDTAVPLGDASIVALGEAWQAPSGVWWKVSIDGTEAWANQRFLGSTVAGVERFGDVANDLDSLEFETLTDATLAVAQTRASTEPESRVVVIIEPLLFEDGGRAIVDVLDLGDDALKGERLDVTVETIYDESGAEGAQDVLGVRVTSVRIIPICGRGVSGGLCS